MLTKNVCLLSRKFEQDDPEVARRVATFALGILKKKRPAPAQ